MQQVRPSKGEASHKLSFILFFRHTSVTKCSGHFLAIFFNICHMDSQIVKWPVLIQLLLVMQLQGSNLFFCQRTKKNKGESTQVLQQQSKDRHQESAESSLTFLRPWMQIIFSLLQFTLLRCYLLSE